MSRAAAVVCLVLTLVGFTRQTQHSGGHTARPAAATTALEFSEVAATAAITPTSAANAQPARFPTAVSSNGRYLVDQDGAPYLLVGDSPHSLAVNLTVNQMKAYFADREKHGFDAVLVQVVCGAYTGNQYYPDTFATYDDIAPFRTARDIATPNPAYFARLKTLVSIAKEHGIEVILDPADTGALALDSSFLAHNGVKRDRSFGVYLGKLFKNYPNVMWQSGNDYQSSLWADDDKYVTAIAKGIRSAAPKQLQTVELDYPVSTSEDDPNWTKLINLNAVYTYQPTYLEMRHAYGESPRMPIFLTEANYEFEDLMGSPPVPATLRRQEYWAMTSGATGQLYGNHYTWDETSWSQLMSNLDTTGVTQLGYLDDLLRSLPWSRLRPDRAHRLVTGNLGRVSSTMNLLRNYRVTAAYTPSGAAAVVYLPDHDTVTVHMSRMGGRVTARWFDPTLGTYTKIGRYSNTGTRQFTTPAAHADGYDDWALVLTAA